MYFIRVHESALLLLLTDQYLATGQWSKAEGAVIKVHRMSKYLSLRASLERFHLMIESVFFNEGVEMLLLMKR